MPSAGFVVCSARALVDQSVQLPVTGASNGTPEPAGLMQPVPTPGACDILTLDLGPLDLDLLGLRVALDEVNLLIEAIPGAGNLLGNLLCGIAGLLDGGLGSGLGGLLADLLAAIANLLNGLLGPLARCPVRARPPGPHGITRRSRGVCAE